MDEFETMADLEGTRGTEGTPVNGAASSDSPENLSEGTREPTRDELAAIMESATVDPIQEAVGAKPAPFPDTQDRPCFRVYDDYCGPEGKHPPGVYWHGQSKADPPQPVDTRFCSPLHVKAVTCTDDGHYFGRCLRFRDTFGRWREWGMPMEMLRGSCEELRGQLLGAGVDIDPDTGRKYLAKYLTWRIPTRRVIAAIRTGWTVDGTAFVLPGQVIGSKDVIFQAEMVHQEGAARASGDFGIWKRDVAALCVGNPVLAVSLCVTLAGPLLPKVHRDSGGIHWHGDSSSGKTTGLVVGGSVWGGEGFIRTWHGTANGFEGAAAALNHTCLCLDEINQADPREIGAVIYALGNGVGKARANRIGSARTVHRWRLSLLSTGERTLAAQMAEGGKQPKAGQLMRLLNVPAARKYGTFDELHALPDGRALADHLKTVTGQHYGHAGPAFIEAMLKDGRDFGAGLADVEALPAFKAEDGQEARVASRFALYGMAGELATKWGILPWPEGEALKAAGMMYKAWREARGKGTTEDRQILQAVADFIAKHGDGRFSRKGNGEVADNVVFRDRAGWWIDSDVGRVYLFTAEALRDAAKGYDFKRVLNALESAGWIREHDTGKRSKKTDIGGRKKLSLYWILPGEMDE